MYVWQSINVERERGTSLQESLPTFLFCPGPGACESIARAYCRASRNRSKHILPNRTHALHTRSDADGRPMLLRRSRTASRPRPAHTETETEPNGCTVTPPACVAIGCHDPHGYCALNSQKLGGT